MAMSLLLAMNVDFQSAELVMNMNEKMETSHAPSARLGTRDTKVRVIHRFLCVWTTYILNLS